MGEYLPTEGFGWNPLKRHRNIPCPCGSGKKAKRCHGQSDTMHKEDIERVKKYLSELALYGFIKLRECESA